MAPETLLHAARMSRGLSLDDVARQTKLSPRVVHALDEGRFADLPAGIYARSYVRTFAAAVSADARTVEERLIPLLPQPGDPVDGVRAIAGIGEPDQVRHAATGAVCAAALLDGLLLSVLNAALVGIIAAASRIPPADLLSGRGVAAAALCAVATLSYFILFAGIDGRTPGRALCGLPRLEAPAPLRARHIVRRAARIGLEEASLVLTWAGLAARRSG